MFRRSPRAALLWAAAAIVAVITAATVINTLSTLRDQATTFGRIQSVLVARRDLAVGVQISPADVTIRKLRGEAPEPDTLTRNLAAVGRVVRVPLLRGATLTARHLTATTRSGLGGVVPAGRRAVRLVIEHGLRPTAGDLVDVYATFDPATLGDDQDPTILVAPAVLVLTVDGAPDAGETLGDTVGITVLVTPRQAGRLAFSVATGILSLALAPPEAASTTLAP